MAIPFNPPEELIRSYYNQPQPAEQANAGIQQALQNYMQMKALDKKNQDDALAQYVKAFEAGGPAFAESVRKLTKLREAPALPGTTPAMSGGATAGVMPWQPPASAPSPMSAPMPTDDGEQQMSMEPAPWQEPPQMSMASQSPIVSHWHQTMGGQQQQAAPAQVPAAAPVPAPAPAFPQGRSPTAVPGFDDPEALLNMGNYGSKRLAAGEALGKYRSAQEANQPVSSSQYGALQGGQEEDLTREFPNGIPRMLAGQSLSAQSRNVRITNDPYGNPIRVPVSGGPATPIQYPKTNLNPLQTKLNPNEYKEFQGEVNDFDKDKVVADNRSMLNSVSNVETMLKNYNPSLTGPLASRQARAIAGEVAALTDSDIVRQALDPSLLGRLKKAVSVGLTGELPKDQLELLRQSISAIKQGAGGRINSVARERASRLSTKFGGRVSPDELMQSMNLPTNFVSQTYPTAQGATSASIPTISSDADFNALPSGAQFKDPSGQVHRKK